MRHAGGLAGLLLLASVAGGAEEDYPFGPTPEEWEQRSVGFLEDVRGSCGHPLGLFSLVWLRTTREAGPWAQQLVVRHLGLGLQFIIWREGGHAWAVAPQTRTLNDPAPPDGKDQGYWHRRPWGVVLPLRDSALVGIPICSLIETVHRQLRARGG